MSRDTETARVALHAVRESSLLGIVSTEITDKTGIPNNRITGALSRLLDLGCVRREKIYGYAARYRYWFVRELPDDEAPAALVIDVPVTRKPAAIPARHKADMTGVTIRLAIDGAKAVTVTAVQARKVFNQLRVIFGG